MVPRIDMCAVSIDVSYEELIETFKEYRYTRIPVYEESIDNIIGIINMKDLLFYDKAEKFEISKYLRTAFYTYEYKKLSELMLEMKKTQLILLLY